VNPRSHRIDAVGKITMLYAQTNGAIGLGAHKGGRAVRREGDGKRLQQCATATAR